MKKGILNFLAGVARLAVVSFVACALNAAVHAEDELVALHDQTLYANWSLPISEMDADGLQFYCEENERASAWNVREGAGFSGGPALELAKCGWDKFHNVYIRCTNGVGTISFRWRNTAFASSYGYLSSYGAFEIGTCGNYKWYYESENWREGKFEILNADEGEVEVYIYGYVDETPGVIQLSDFKWTPAPETVQINFETRGGGTCEPMVVKPGQTVNADELPIPSHGDWTFAGWYMPDEDNYFPMAYLVEDIDVPMSDVTVYADWQLPVSVFDVDGVTFTSTGDSYANVGKWDWMTPWWTMPVDSNLCANIEIPWDGKDFKPKARTSAITAMVRGPAIFSFDMTFDVLDAYLMDFYLAVEDVERFYRGSAKFSLLLDGKKLLEWSESSSAHNEKISIPTGTHKLVFELTGTPTLLDWGYDDISVFFPSVTVKNFKYLENVPQETFGAWANTLRDNGAWIKGDLPRFVKAYEERLAANPADYEAHILHAVTILAQLAESKTVADYAKKFGFTLDYLGMKVDGSLAKPSSWPAANATVDQFVKEAVPVIKDALADLEAIPDGWTGTVLLPADEYPVDEDTEIDIGDVLYARAGLEASIGLAYFAHSYDLTVDYAKVDKARASGDSIAFKFLTEQTKFMAKVRNASSLLTSKSWMTAALTRALKADAAVLARDDYAMHFIEYDLKANGDMIDKARNLTQKALASLAAPQGIDIQGEVLGDREVPFGISLLPVGDNGLLQVYLGALFEGKITRDHLPTFQKGVDGSPVPVMETVKDATFAGLLPEFTTRTWTEVLKALGRDVAHQTITVKLDANGGKTSVKSVSLGYDEESDGCLYPDLPVPTNAGGIFAGWATAKTDGAIVRAGDFYDAGLFAGAKAPTLYAQWLKTYEITVKGEGLEASWSWSDEQRETLPAEVLDGETAMDDNGRMSVPEGAMVYVQTDDSSVGKDGRHLVFQKWTVSSSKAVLGPDFRVSDSSTMLVMPPEKLTLQATYADESVLETWHRMSAIALASPVRIDKDTIIEPPANAFEWSPDGGKTWYKASSGGESDDESGFYDYETYGWVDIDGEIALLKAGKYTITWRSSDPNWKAPDGKWGYDFWGEGSSEYGGVLRGTFTYVPQIAVDVMTFVNGELTASPAGGAATMAAKDGLVPAGKAIALTAKAAKNYAFQGWAYRKNWEYGDGFDAIGATWKLENYMHAYHIEEEPYYYEGTWLDQFIDPVDKKVHVVAVFKALSDYSAADIRFYGFEGLASSAEAATDAAGNASVTVNAVVGCALDDEYSLVCGPLASPLAYKLEGKLPDGLKFDAKTGGLSGVPKKAGNTTVKITAADPAKNAKPLTVNFVVSPLPTWLVGEYQGIAEGHLFGFSDMAYGDPQQCGTLSLSVKSDGKVSAKISTCFGTASVSGALSWSQDDGNDTVGTYSFSGGKNGWWCNPVWFSPDGTIDGTINSYDSRSGRIVADVTGMRQDADLLAKSNFMDKYYTFAFCAMNSASNYTYNDGRYPDVGESNLNSGYGYLTIKTDKKGVAKVTGQLPDGEKVSVSALMLPFVTNDVLKARLHVFASPSSYKKQDWFVMSLDIRSDGFIEAEEGGVWTPAPAFSDGYMDGNYAPLVGEGALYSSAATLENHYWTAFCEYSEAVLLQYKGTGASDHFGGDVGGGGGGHGGAAYEDTYASEFFGRFFEVEVKGDKKGAISLVEKSPAPWVENGEWNYSEDKKGNKITDPSQLSISFAKATGIFTGKASVYFDEPKPTSASLPYSGVMIHDGADGYRGFGSAVYTYKYSYNDNYGKAKTDTKKVTLPVLLDPADASYGD